MTITGQPSERNRRLAANILAGRSPLDGEMLRTIRADALADLNVPPPRVLQLVDEVERLRAASVVLDALELAERLAELDAIDTRTPYSYQEQAHFLLTGETPVQRTAKATK